MGLFAVIKEVEEEFTHDLGLTPQDFSRVFSAFGLAYREASAGSFPA